MPMATPEPSTDHINSLPLVDLRLLSQSELYTLSLSGATHRHRRSNDDAVIPKIDRSVFNESAGSRKQTFSRLRLNKQNAAVPASSFHIPLHIPEPLDEENSQIISLLQELFGVESLRNRPATDDVDEGRLVPVQVEFKQAPPESAGLQNIPIDVVDSNQKKRKRGRPRKNEYLETPVEEEPPKVNGNGDGKTVEVEGKTVEMTGKTVEMVNEKGFVVDAVRLAEAADQFGEELKRRTQGMETESQLLEFLETLNGEWGSERKKRRFVQASALGDLLPTGWKIVLTLMRRAGRASVVCRRYVSPDGHQFESLKEVSAYLLSFFGVQDISHFKSIYTGGSQQLSSSINMGSESLSVGHAPAGGMKINANPSYLSLAGASVHFNQEKQTTISSSIGSEKFNSDMALGCKLGDTTSGAVRDMGHQTEDKQLMKADKNGSNSVQGCSLMEDRVCTVHSEKLVGTVEASDAACNLYIPLVFSSPFSNNNSNNGQFSDEMNAATCLEGGIRNFASQDGNMGCYETVPSGNEQTHVDNNGLGLSVKLVEENIQNINFERSMLAPNSEGKIVAGKNLEDGDLISSLEDMEIRDGEPIEDKKQQIFCSRDQPEFEDVSTNVKLQCSSEGCSPVPSQIEFKHTSINSMDRAQTLMLKNSAEENFFDSDLFGSSIDGRTCVRSGYIGDVSFSSCTEDASESGGVDFTPDLNVTKDVSDNHIPANEEAVTNLQERSFLNDQSCTMDNLLHHSASNLFALTGNQHPSAFHDNVNNFSIGTFDALKAVDTGCMKPQLGIVSCSSVVAVDAYTPASIMQGRSQGCESVPLGGSILNQFNKQSDDGVNKANESCSLEKAKNEVEIFQTNTMDLPKFR